MAEDDGDILIRAMIRDEITGPLQNIEKQLGRVQTQMKKTSKTASDGWGAWSDSSKAVAKATEAQATGLQRFIAATNNSDTSLGKLTNRVDRFVSGAGQRLLRWAKYAAGGLLAIGARSAFSFAVQLEKAQVAITGILGSKGQADRLINELKLFARKTPFNFENVVGSAQQLLAVGFKQSEIIPTLTSLGDAAAYLGGGNQGLERMITNLGQINAAQKVSTRDMNDFAMNKVPIWDLMSKKLGITTGELRDLISTAGGGAKVFQRLGGRQGIAALIGSRFTGGMEAQSKTFSGIMSNLVDSFNQGAEPLMTSALGFGKKFGKRLGDSMADNLPLAFAAFKRGNTSQGAGLLSQAFLLGADGKEVILTVISLVQSLWPVVKGTARVLLVMAHGFAQTLRFLRPFAPLLPVIVTGLLGLLVVVKVASGIEKLITTFGTLQKAFGLLQKGWVMLNATFAISPIGLIVIGVIAAGAAIYLLWKRSETFRTTVKLLGAAAAAAFGWVVDKVKAVWHWMGRIIDRARSLAKNPFVKAALVATGPIGGAIALAAGDRRTPVHSGTPRGFDRSHLARSSALFGAASSMTPGGQRVTSTVRGWGVSPSSDHLTGRAFDVAGANLPQFASNVRAAGGHAELHGSGPTRHVHAVGDRATPVGAMRGGSGGAPLVGEVTVVIQGDASRSDAAHIARVAGAEVARRVRESQERA